MPYYNNLHLASSSAIKAALSNLRLNFNSINCWQNSSNNRYIVDTDVVIGSDFQTGSINHNELVNYIATSTCIHCFNGWSYLTSAMNSLLEGDYANAIHNAYYGELRGIMSILGTQGIGVFNGNNVVIDSTGTAHEVSPRRSPTHVFAKHAFDDLLNNPLNSNLILDSLLIENVSLKDWITATGFSTYLPFKLASAQLLDWSLDLNLINTEQKFRNYVSYNPQNFDLSISRSSDNIQTRLKFVSELRQLCSPNGDFLKPLLRSTYESIYMSLFNTPLSSLDSDMRKIIHDLGKNPFDLQNDNVVKFLIRQSSPNNNLVFDYANSIRYSTPVLEQDTDPMGIISRASLILMINTKVLESMFISSGITKTDLKFWYDSTGIKLGYWDIGGEPTLLSDLWEDVKYEIDDIDAWLNSTSTNFSPYNYKRNLGTSLYHIKSFGKACFWGLGLE